MKYKTIVEALKAMDSMKDALLSEIAYDNAREHICPRLGALYKALEELESEMDLTAEEIFGEQIDEIQTPKGA